MALSLHSYTLLSLSLSFSFLPRALFVTLSSSPSSLVRSLSLAFSVLVHSPLYPNLRDSLAITRFLLLYCSVRRPVRVTNTSKVIVGRIRGLVPLVNNTVATNETKRGRETLVAGEYSALLTKVSRGRGCTKAPHRARSSLVFGRLDEPIKSLARGGFSTHYRVHNSSSGRRFNQIRTTDFDAVPLRFLKHFREKQHDTSPRFYRYLGRCLSAARRFALCLGLCHYVDCEERRARCRIRGTRLLYPLMATDAMSVTIQHGVNIQTWRLAIARNLARNCKSRMKFEISKRI